MKNFTKIAAIAASIATLFTLSSCEEDLKEPEVLLPSISDVKVVGSASDESATIAIEGANAAQVYYAYYASSDEPAEADKAWESAELVDGAAEVTLSDLEPSTNYTVEAYAEAAGAKSPVFSFDFDTAAPSAPSISLKDNTPADATNAGQIIVSVEGATSFFWGYYAGEERPEELEMVEVVCDKGDGDYTVDITGLAINTEDRSIYTFEAYAVNGDVPCDAALMPFQTVAAVLLTVGEPVCNPLIITVDVAINKDACEGYAYTFSESDWYDPSMLTADIEAGFATFVTEDGTIVCGNENYLTPNTAYTIAIVPISGIEESTNDWGETIKSAKVAGEAIEIEANTSALSLGGSDIEVKIELNEDKITFTDLAATFYKAEGAGGFYNGTVPASDAPDIEAYVAQAFADNVYMGCQPFSEYDYMTSQVVPLTEKELNFAGLNDNTEYYIFAVAITDEGALGKISYVKAKTKGLEVDASIKPEISIVAGATSASVTIEFDKCQKVLYSNEPVLNPIRNEEQILASFIGDLTSLYNGYDKETNPNVVDGKIVHEISYLGIGESYNFYYLGVDENGVIGELQCQTYSTVAPTYDSSASLNITENEGSGFIDDEWGGTVKLDLNIEFTGGAVAYYQYQVHPEYVNYSTDPKAWGDYVLKCSPQKQEGNELVITQYAAGYTEVFIPIDADGNYGMPILYTTDYWPPKEDDNTGGASPFNN